MDAPAAAVSVPPVQVVEALGVAATSTPVGRLSVKLRDVASPPLALLLMVKVTVDVPPMPIDAGANALAKVGAVAVTVRFTAVESDGPNDELRVMTGLVWVPVAVPVTSTVTVQLADAAAVPEAKLMVLLAATAVGVPAAQVVAAFGVAATTTPVGRLSVNDRPVASEPLAVLLMVKVTVELLPMTTLAGANALAKVGGDPNTPPEIVIAPCSVNSPFTYVKVVDVDVGPPARVNVVVMVHVPLPLVGARNSREGADPPETVDVHEPDVKSVGAWSEYPDPVPASLHSTGM